jgi:hypothetical protein
MVYYIRGLIKNIRDRICCRETKASTSYSKISPSKYDPPDCMQRFQRSFHFSMHVWQACLGMACNCRIVFSCISATSWSRSPWGCSSDWGRERSRRAPNLVSKAGGEPRGCCAVSDLVWEAGEQVLPTRASFQDPASVSLGICQMTGWVH